VRKSTLSRKTRDSKSPFPSSENAEMSKTEVLDWENEAVTVDSVNENAEFTSPETSEDEVHQSASNSEHIDSSTEIQVPRSRRQPAWLFDYETSFSVEEESLMALMMSLKIPNHSKRRVQINNGERL